MIGLYKDKCIHTTVFHAGPTGPSETSSTPAAGWVDWYNNRRLHGSLGMTIPVEFEQAHYAALNREPQPAQERRRTWDASENLGRFTPFIFAAGLCHLNTPHTILGMPTLRPNLRWIAAAIAVLVALGALVWVLQRDAGTDATRSARSTSDVPSPATAQQSEQVSNSTPAPTASATHGAADPSTDRTGGPTDGRSSGEVRGNGDRTGPDNGGPAGAGKSSGVKCWGGSERAPLSSVPGDATSTEVRHQVAANLQLLREMSPPSTITADVEGLRSYYRRVGQVVGTDGRDGPLTPKDRNRVEQLTQDVYARFAPDVVDFLKRQC